MPSSIMWDQSNVMKESKHCTRLMIRTETAQAKILLQRTPLKQKPQIIPWTLKGGFGDVNKWPGSTCCPTGVPSLDFIPSTSNLLVCQILAHVVAFFCPLWAKCSCGQFAMVRKYQVNKQHPWSRAENQKIQLAAGKTRTRKKPQRRLF